MSFCQWCSHEYQAKDSRQIYCDADCRNMAAKAKVAERTIRERRRKRIAKPKKCVGGCGRYVSAYNDSLLCPACTVSKKEMKSFMDELRNYFDIE